MDDFTYLAIVGAFLLLVGLPSLVVAYRQSHGSTVSAPVATRQAEDPIESLNTVQQIQLIRTDLQTLDKVIANLISRVKDAMAEATEKE
jgi:hypothetical protein